MAIVAKSEESSHKEMGTSLMFIGLAIWVTDALVAFFFPSAVRIGREGTFLAIMLVLAATGLGLMLGGYVIRGKPEE